MVLAHRGVPDVPRSCHGQPRLRVLPSRPVPKFGHVLRRRVPALYPLPEQRLHASHHLLRALHWRRAKLQGAALRALPHDAKYSLGYREHARRHHQAVHAVRAAHHLPVQLHNERLRRSRFRHDCILHACLRVGEVRGHSRDQRGCLHAAHQLRRRERVSSKSKGDI